MKIGFVTIHDSQHESAKMFKAGPTAADRSAMMRRATPIGDRILGGNPKIKPMYDLIKAAAAKHRGAKPPM